MERRALLGLKPRRTSGGGSSGGENQPSFTRLPTVTATIARPDGRRSMLSIEVGLDTPDAALRARIAQSQPRLSAAYNSAAGRFAASLRPGFPPDVEALIRALQTATDQTLGRPGGRVLIGTVLIA